MQEEERQEKLSREEFDEVLQEQVEQSLGTNYQVTKTQVQKNNGVWKKALLIREESSDCAPSFYLEEMYQSYCMGQPFEALAEHVVEAVHRETFPAKETVEQMLTKPWFEERLFLRLVNYEKNKEQLKQAVYVRRFDLAAVFYVLTEQSEDGVKSFCLPRLAWEHAGLGEPEAYYDTVLANTERLFPAELMRLEEGLVRCMARNGEALPEWLIDELSAWQRENRLPMFYILTNAAKINGAMALFYNGALERLADWIGQDFYVIPSSVHETLLLAGKEVSEEALNQMVREVNETQVLPEEVLADHVYRYEIGTGLQVGTV